MAVASSLISQRPNLGVKWGVAGVWIPSEIQHMPDAPLVPSSRPTHVMNHHNFSRHNSSHRAPVHAHYTAPPPPPPRLLLPPPIRPSMHVHEHAHHLLHHVKVLKISPTAQLSGFGNANNYYHMLIDLSVRIYNECELWANNSRHCIIYVMRGAKGRYDRPLPSPIQSLFQPTGPWARHFYSIFGDHVKMLHVSREELHKVNGTMMSFREPDRVAMNRLEAWTADPGRLGEWSRMPPIYFERFRKAVASKSIGNFPTRWMDNATQQAANHARAATTIPPGSVLVIERSNLSTTRLNDALTGERRFIPDALRVALREWAAQDGVLDRLHFVEPHASWSVAEQARLFRSARLVIANHGAGCTNVVFCEPGTHFVELPPVLFPCYRNLAQRSGLHYHSVPLGSTLPLVRYLWRDWAGLTPTWHGGNETSATTTPAHCLSCRASAASESQQLVPAAGAVAHELIVEPLIEDWFASDAWEAVREASITIEAKASRPGFGAFPILLMFGFYCLSLAGCAVGRWLCRATCNAAENVTSFASTIRKEQAEVMATRAQAVQRDR